MTDVRDWSDSDYSRIYHAFLRDPKFATIRTSERLMGAYTLLLVFADMTYPNPAPVPSTVTRPSLKALVDAGVVTVEGGLYQLVGLAKERSARYGSGKGRPRYPSDERPPKSERDRSTSGVESESSRSEPEPHAGGRASGSIYDSVSSSSSGGSGGTPDDDPFLEAMTWLSAHRAGISSGSATGIALARLADQHGGPVVIDAFERLLAADESLRDGSQFVYGARKLLNPIPDPHRTGRVPAKGMTNTEDLERAVERV